MHKYQLENSLWLPSPKLNEGEMDFDPKLIRIKSFFLRARRAMTHIILHDLGSFADTVGHYSINSVVAGSVSTLRDVQKNLGSLRTKLNTGEKQFNPTKAHLVNSNCKRDHHRIRLTY